LATIWHGQITAEAFQQLEAAVKDKGGKSCTYSWLHYP
jgi:hypothetical protein